MNKDAGGKSALQRCVMRVGSEAIQDAPSYWFGVDRAPHFNRQVAKAHEAVKAAEDALRESLRLGYPEGKRVTVIHHRGHFYGYVVGWDHDGCRVVVKNENTLKVSKWWAAHVQLCPYN